MAPHPFWMSAGLRGPALIAALVALLMFPASSTSAAGGPIRTPVPDSGAWLDFQAGDVCPFALMGRPVENNVVMSQFTMPNRDYVEKYTGHAVERYTNVATDKSLTRKVSGPATYIFHPDGSWRMDLVGPGLLVMTPGSLAPAGTSAPGAYVFSGHFTATFPSPGDP